jgi:rhomboid protease GluP
MVSVHNHRFLIASDVMLRVVKKAFPVVSVSLAVATLVISSSIAIRVHGSPWSNVTIRELRNHGGVANDQLARGEWWRLLTAQFIHVNQWHMLFNIITLFLLAAAVERATGPFVLAFIWLLSGATGMYASIYSVQEPYDVGTGASQALMGVAAACIVIIKRKYDDDNNRCWFGQPPRLQCPLSDGCSALSNELVKRPNDLLTHS